MGVTLGVPSPNTTCCPCGLQWLPPFQLLLLRGLVLSQPVVFPLWSLLASPGRLWPLLSSSVCGRAHSAFSWFPGAWAPAAGSGCFWSTRWLPALRAVRHCAGFWDGGKRTRTTQPYPGPAQSLVGAGWSQTSARDTESPLNDARTRRVPMLWVCPEVPVLGKSLEEALKDE